MTIFSCPVCGTGQGWRFLIWGGLHGIAMVIQRLWGDRKFLPKPMAWLFTFLFVNFAWVFFRAGRVRKAAGPVGRLVSGGGGCPVRTLPEAY